LRLSSIVDLSVGSLDSVSISASIWIYVVSEGNYGAG